MHLWGELNVYSMVLRTNNRECHLQSVEKFSWQGGSVLWEEVKIKKENSTLNTESVRSLSYHTVAYFLNDISLITKNNVLPRWLGGKEPACDAGDAGSVPGWGRSPAGRHSNPLQYSCLENLMDRGDWRGRWSIGSQKVRHEWSDLACMHKVQGEIYLKLVKF